MRTITISNTSGYRVHVTVREGQIWLETHEPDGHKALALFDLPEAEELALALDEACEDLK